MKKRSEKLFGCLCALSIALTATIVEASSFYVISNKSDGNTVVGFQKTESGAYHSIGEFATGGLGTGDLEIPALEKDETHPLANGDDPLISANALVATEDGKHLLAVNPGDATISLLAVKDDKSLKALGTAKATDKFPVSIAVHGDVAVVAAVGPDNGSGSVGAYRIVEGALMPVDGSRRDLKARPSTVAFSDDGRHVIVNELVTGKIKVFANDSGNLSADPVSVIDSPRDAARFQAIPVGFAVGGDKIFMSEARFLTPDFKLREEKDVVVQSPLYSWQTGSLSTYRLASDGSIELVSGDVLTGDAIEGGEIANCWVALSRGGEFLWAVNALSSSISSFRIRENGTAALLNARAFKDPSESLFFSDIALSTDGTEIYQLVGNRGQVVIFGVEESGDLTPRQTVDGLPEIGSYGLAVL